MDTTMKIGYIIPGMKVAELRSRNCLCLSPGGIHFDGDPDIDIEAGDDFSDL